MSVAEPTTHAARIAFERIHPIRVTYADGSSRRFSNLITAAEAALETGGALMWQSHRMSAAACRALAHCNRSTSEPHKRLQQAEQVAQMYVQSDLKIRKLAA